MTRQLPALGQGEEYSLGSVEARFYSLDEHRHIVEWRKTCFEKAGLNRLQAQTLAVRRDVDRALVERMLTQLAPTQVVQFFAV